ncbi:MAG: zf-HC2 domain-containing protein [Candidatus Tumulicola sp.]
MRCSSCEALLDQYVEAALPPARANAVAAHLRGCAACEDVHQRLRIVDALLTTARLPGLRANFTFDVMAGIRTMPAPAAPRRPLLPLAAFYLVAAWIFVGAALSFVWPVAPAGGRAFAHLAAGTLQAVGASAHALWPVAPIALSVVVSVLSIDVLLFAVLVVFYRTVRPRLTAYLAASAGVP